MRIGLIDVDGHNFPNDIMQIEIPEWKKAKWLTDMRFIKEQSRYDTEAAHSKADDLLCDILTEIGLEEIANEFDAFEKWYS